MKKSLLAVTAAALMMSGAAFAAEVTTTTTWTDAYGNTIREQSTTHHYAPVTDPKVEVRTGVEIPQSVQVYDLPETVTVPERERYSYVIINNHPVVIERQTRRIVHAW